MTFPARLLRTVLRLLGALLALAALAVLTVGVPWGLAHYIGWPLPEHVPTAGELEALLLTPMSVTLLLNLLACIAWVSWFFFVVDVARCVPEALRGVRPPSAGPLHALAGLLVAAVLIGGTPPRSPAPSTPITDALANAQPAVTRTVAATSNSTTLERTREAEPGTVIVQPPQHGIHDTLWRIARRELGDGTRWPELFHLNQGRVQVDGTVLTDPDLIRPGWALVLPGHTTDTPTPTDTSDQPVPSEPAPDPLDPAQADTPQSDEEPVTTTSGAGVITLTGGFLAAGLASVVTLALAIRHRRRRRTYQPGSGPREGLAPLAPVVRSLRLSEDQRRLGLGEDTDESAINIASEDTETEETTRHSLEAEQGVLGAGVRDGRTCAVDLAMLKGLGLTGAGAEATARALLVHLLATTTATVLLPEREAVILLGTDIPHSPRLQVIDDLEVALTELSRNNTNGSTTVLLTSAETVTPRLQSHLETGSTEGLVGLLLGHWPAGGTVRIRADGLVTATSPNVKALDGARLFHLDATDTRDLLDLLTEAVPITEEPPPAPVPELDQFEAEIEPDVDDSELLQKPTFEIEEDHHPTDVESEETRESDPELPDEVPASRRPFIVTVLGQVTLQYIAPDGQHDLTTALSPKHKALLVFLALHPEGTRREAAREALWPDARGSRPYNPLYAGLSQMRKALGAHITAASSDLIIHQGEQIALCPENVEVDYWRFHRADHDRRVAATDQQRLEASERIVACYTGDLAEGTSALWLEGPREAAHRTALDALAGLASHHRGTDPHRSLQLLEHARLLSPTNEDIYRDIMRLQAELGLTDAISRTLHLLTTTLTELGARPDPNTITLARALQAREHAQSLNH